MGSMLRFSLFFTRLKCAYEIYTRPDGLDLFSVKGLLIAYDIIIYDLEKTGVINTSVVDVADNDGRALHMTSIVCS